MGFQRVKQSGQAGALRRGAVWPACLALAGGGGLVLLYGCAGRLAAPVLREAPFAGAPPASGAAAAGPLAWLLAGTAAGLLAGWALAAWRRRQKTRAALEVAEPALDRDLLCLQTALELLDGLARRWRRRQKIKSLFQRRGGS